MIQPLFPLAYRLLPRTHPVRHLTLSQPQVTSQITDILTIPLRSVHAIPVHKYNATRLSGKLSTSPVLQKMICYSPDRWVTRQEMKITCAFSNPWRRTGLPRFARNDGQLVMSLREAEALSAAKSLRQSNLKEKLDYHRRLPRPSKEELAMTGGSVRNDG